MIDRITDGVLVLGPDWRCRYVNAAAAEMLGRTPADLLGANIWDKFPPPATRSFRAVCEQAVRERRSVQLVEYYAPRERWFEGRCFPQQDDLAILFCDVTDRRAAEGQLSEYSDRMSEAERIAGFGVWRWDLATGEVLWSDELHRIYGLPVGDFAGTVDGFISYLHPDDRDPVWAAVEDALKSLEPFAFEERIIRADGEERVLYSHGRVIAGQDGEAEAIVGVCHDVTERSLAERALGLSERRMRAILDYTPSIISVKDLEGHYLMANAECGRVLGMDPEEIIGQECAALFPELAEDQRENDRRATTELEPVYDLAVLSGGEEPRTYVTVTFALPDESGRPAETCTIGTDVTERRERESARRERTEWAHRLDSALAEDRMLVYAQPIVDLATGQPDGYELLVRMQEDGRLLEPSAFLPAAERFGSILHIDHWMVERALALTSRIAPRVNLSAVTLCSPIARREIIALLRAQPEAAHRLVFEITETATAEHLDAALEFADQLIAVGCGLALDDFGTGFGSFTYLRRLPLRYLKIDQSFILDLARSGDDQRVVLSIIGIAAQFGLRTIAEGVEDGETLRLLRQLGAEYAQGFHLGRPAPVSEIAKLSDTA
jgi:PAS domain S-box-containing protein